MITRLLLAATLLTAFGCAANPKTARNIDPAEPFVGTWYTSNVPPSVGHGAGYVSLKIRADHSATARILDKRGNQTHGGAATWERKAKNQIALSAGNNSHERYTLHLLGPNTLSMSSNDESIRLRRITTPVKDFLGQWQDAHGEKAKLVAKHMFLLTIRWRGGFATFSGNWRRFGNDKLVLKPDNDARHITAALFDRNTLVVNVQGGVGAAELHRAKQTH